MRMRGRCRGQEGTVIVFLTLLIVPMIGVAAIAVDLAALRWDRRADRAASDFATTAAGSFLQPTANKSAPAACERAWSVTRSNLGDAEAVTTSPDCSTFASACDEATGARSTTGVAGPYTVTITHPVPDDHKLMQGTGGPKQSIDPTIDGESCERFALRIVRQRSHSFATVLGVDSGSTDVHSVSRADLDAAHDSVITLLLLEQTRCDALRAEGNGTAIIQASPPDSEGVISPGHIVIDSDGSQCEGGFTVDATGSTSKIEAQPSPDRPGQILLYAMSPDAATCSAPACDPADVSATPARLTPQPKASGFPIGRAPVDHRYNCKTSYSFSAPWTGKVPACSPAAPHIDDLVSAYQFSQGVAPSGFSVYPQDHPGGTCDLGGGAAPFTLSGNWYFNCPAGFTVRTSVTVTGHAVFEAGVEVTSGTGVLRIGDGTSPSVAYVRDGSIVKRGQGRLELQETFVYLHDGGIDLQAGTGLLEWTAPLSGDFANLALWSESTKVHTLAGQAGTMVEGVFFTPNAGYGTSSPFEIVGSSGDFQTSAQFVVYRLRVSGDGEVHLRPNPDTALPISQNLGIRLIR